MEIKMMMMMMMMMMISFVSVFNHGITFNILCHITKNNLCTEEMKLVESMQ
jgi:hypothetical protein